MSRAGDYTKLQARMDFILGVTSCSVGKCNNFRYTAMEGEIYAPGSINDSWSDITRPYFLL